MDLVLSYELLATFVPIVVYWVYSEIYTLFSRFDRYKLHSKKEEIKNLVSERDVIKGVLIQQSVQATFALIAFKMGVTFLLLEPASEPQTITQSVELSNPASLWFLGLFISIILTSVPELRWSGLGIGEWWRNEQFWVIGGVSAHPMAVFQGFLQMLAGLDTNFTLTSKASYDGDFGELYAFKWTTLLIPPTKPCSYS